jgi:UDP-N-acetylmuramoylalanine-D-glutamate ligase
MYDLGDLSLELDKISEKIEAAREDFREHKVDILASERVRVFDEFNGLQSRLDRFRSIVDDLERGISL